MFIRATVLQCPSIRSGEMNVFSNFIQCPMGRGGGRGGGELEEG